MFGKPLRSESAARAGKNQSSRFASWGNQEHQNTSKSRDCLFIELILARYIDDCVRRNWAKKMMGLNYVNLPQRTNGGY